MFAKCLIHFFKYFAKNEFRFLHLARKKEEKKEKKERNYTQSLVNFKKQNLAKFTLQADTFFENAKDMRIGQRVFGDDSEHCK